MEYQINIENGDGLKGEHLSYRFGSVDVRDETYNSICSKFKNDKVNMEYLRNHGGVTVSTYNYCEPIGNGIIELTKHKAIN